jgi:hypothetical protein
MTATRLEVSQCAAASRAARSEVHPRADSPVGAGIGNHESLKLPQTPVMPDFGNAIASLDNSGCLFRSELQVVSRTALTKELAGQCVTVFSPAEVPLSCQQGENTGNLA